MTKKSLLLEANKKLEKLPLEKLQEVMDFAKEKTFQVTWHEGTSWGDLGVDFTIKDRAILNESCGD